MNSYDCLYAAGLIVSAPIWLARQKTRRKVFSAFRERMGHAAPRTAAGPAVLIHAVSLGEMNATRALVTQLAEARADLQFIITTTTQTGWARGQQLYGADRRITLVRFPLDFSLSLRRIFEALRPDIVVLMELEVWPNLMRQCAHRGIPVLLINGRLTESSFRGYRLAGPLSRRMFRRLAAACVQDELYADRFAALGTPRQKIRVTGTMKFDNAQIESQVDGAADLAADVGIRPGQEQVWVCGSTGPGEEAIILDAYRRLHIGRPMRLVIVPRHPERFDDVARLIVDHGFRLTRRSEKSPRHDADACAVVLGDTMGELRKFYSLADVVLVGRTLVDLGPRQHGSDMIEPAALAKPTIVGPFTHNFAEPMRKFLAAGAIRQILSAAELESAVRDLLDVPGGIGQRAQKVVAREQGATARHAEVILEHLNIRLTALGSGFGRIDS